MTPVMGRCDSSHAAITVKVILRTLYFAVTSLQYQ